ncbi:MAG: DUF1616 domain-containing protein [Candidatus Methanoperedens sp.]|nr:DUF1616 domain-containing protein [Candidatus Methanoperedens sp.]
MEIELKELIIKVLKESKESLSPAEIFNYMILNDLIHHSVIYHLEILHIRLICNILVHDGILVEKESGKYAYIPGTEAIEPRVEQNPETPLHFDIRLSIFLIIFSIIFILIPPFSQTFIRILIALPFLLFLPGYLLISLMFPKKGELSTIERFTLSIGLSIAIVVFDGFGLNYTPWGFRPNSIVISLSIIMGALLLATYFKRKKLGADAYEFSFNDIRSFYFILKSKDPESGPEYDPALEKTLIRTMIIAIILVSAVVLYANLTREPEKFTAFYILGSSGKAENYPDEVYINMPMSLLTGIENYEYQPVNYTIRVQLGGKILMEQPLILKHEGKWLDNVTFIPRMTSSIALGGNDTRQKLEFILLKDNYTYRTVHLWVKPIFELNDFTPDITITNGEMTTSKGWDFTGSNENITGNYTNMSWISPPYSYEINFSANGSRESGELYQNITVGKESIATISFYMRDSYTNATNNISKQVLLDNNVIWETGVGNKSWEKVQIPVFLSKNSRLSFKVYNRLPINDTFQVWWDDIKLVPYVKPAKEKDKQITKPFVLGNSQSLDFKVRGMPIAMTGNASIDGSNFPGFYYDIDENISYERLELSFSNNSMIDAGNATYISTIHGNEITFSGSNYKIIDKNDIGLLSKVLLKNAEKTMDLNTVWNLDNGYSLNLKLISSKGDTALLELQKGGSTVDSKLLGVGGIFEYRATLAQNTAVVFRTRIGSITFNSVKVVETELYSDSPTILKAGDSIGDFEITNISSSNITLKNPDPIKIDDGAMILGNNIRFKVINNIAFPYSVSGEIRGIPQSTLHGSYIIINGSNYPGFNFDIDNMSSTEELSMYFSDNNTVDIGNSTYKTYKNGNGIYFLGESYWLPKTDRINFVSKFTTITKTILKNGSLSLDEGYTLNLKEIQDGGMAIIIRKNMTGSQKKLMENPNISTYSTFLQDFDYDMFTTTFKHGRMKSNMIYEVGDQFEYWIEYDVDSYFLLISGDIAGLDNNNMTITLKQYQVPREFMPGMIFGEFEIESTASDTIILKNFKPLKFDPGKVIPILGGAVRIRTSAKEPVFYPISK